MEVKNAIGVMFDSWQFNYTGCYGNDWIKTPNFDRFAREGVLFENAYGEGMPTVPVRRSLHTGRPYLHDTGWSPLRAKDTMISDLCWGSGIDTALIFDCPMYRLPKHGYTRAFDKVWFLHGHEGDHAHYASKTLYHYKPEDFLTKEHLENGDKIIGGNVVEATLGEISNYLKNRQYWRSAQDQNVFKVMKEAVHYLENVDRTMPFFLWIDSFDPHEPWDPPSVYNPDLKCPYDPTYEGVDEFVPLMDKVDGLYTEKELNHIRMLYAEKVSVCDAAFGYFMDAIRRLGLEESTLMLIISDHGEPMGNGEHGHGIMRKCRPWPYEELVHIPLIIRAPGLPAGKRIPALVQNYDITPTITNWLGISGAEHMLGIDLWPLMTGKVDKIRDFVIAGYYQAAWSFITEEWSYIHWLADERLVKTSAGLLMSSLDQGMETDSVAIEDEKNIALNIRAEDLAAFAEYSKTLSLDGADQWTCTPGARVDVPAQDELYNRKTDPFQLHNVISKHPDVAEDLLRRLKVAMADIVANS